MSLRMRSILGLLMALLLSTASSLPTTVAQAQIPSLAVSDRLRATDKALRWLYLQQNPDGGFGDSGSDPWLTSEVALAFASAYEEPGSVLASGKSPLDYLETQVGPLTTSAEATALLILAVVGGNRDPQDFGTTDLTVTLDTYYHGGSGRYQGSASDGIAAHALAMMAKSASWQTIPPKAITWLAGRQNSDGGWGPLPGQASDTRHTSLSIQALIAAGESPVSQAVRNGVSYLQERQTPDAGFASSASASVSDPQSTSMAVQALLAAGEKLFSSKWSRCLQSPFDALLQDQTGNGSFQNGLAITAAAVPALMGRTMPVPGRYLAATRALEWLHDQQEEDGGFGNGGFTADAVYAIALCGQDAAGPAWSKNGTSALETLEAETQDYLDNAPPGGPAGELSKVIRAVQQAGGDPRNFAGMDLIDELGLLYEPATGKYHPSKVYSHDLALIALHAVTETIPSEAVTALEGAQLGDGGWPWAWGATTPDVDSTGLSMQAIFAGGGPSSGGIVDDGANYLENLRFPSGGYPDLATKPEPNCDSTSLAIQGLLASGMYRQEPLLFGLETGALASSWDALLALQEATGSFMASVGVPESRLLATVEALHALCSPLYPGYQPPAEGETTEAGNVHGKLGCGEGLGVVAPYSGDDDDDGSASLRYRGVGEVSWSEWMEMGKGGLSYVELLGLEEQTEYEIQVSYADPDGVSGEQNQSLNMFVGRACIPLSVGDYTG